MNGWIRQDAWWRREIGDGSYLIASRMTVHPDTVTERGRVLHARWTWRRHSITTGALLDSWPDSHGKSYPCADRAISAADERVKARRKAELADARAARVARREAAQVVARAVAAAEAA
jgi:hypothetical protein